MRAKLMLLAALVAAVVAQPVLAEPKEGAPETTLEGERYSFAFQGRLQTLDHVLVTDGLKNRVGDFRYAHFDNDYFVREDPADGHHVSDHDPPVLTLSK